MEKTAEKTAVVSDRKIGSVIAKPTKKTDKVFVQRRVGCKTIADDMTSRITGKLVGFDDLYDPRTKTFKTEDELKALGAVFITISLNKVLGKSDTTVKSRKTGEKTPFIRKTSKYQVIGNVNWTSYINKRGSGDFVSVEQRANGVDNYENCKAIGIKDTKSGKAYYVNGVAFRVLESTKYFDENGVEHADKAGLEADYLKKASKASLQKEADKHGIDVRFDPKYRTTRIDSCDFIRAFGFEYIPTV